MGKTTAEEIDVEKVKATRCTFNSTQILWHSILYPLYVVYVHSKSHTHTNTLTHALSYCIRKWNNDEQRICWCLWNLRLSNNVQSLTPKDQPCQKCEAVSPISVFFYFYFFCFWRMCIVCTMHVINATFFIKLFFFIWSF